MNPLSSLEIKLCQAQAKIFELSVKQTKYSSPIFIRRFMYSSIAKALDNQVYLFQSDTIYEAFNVINDEFGDSNYGKIKYSEDQMYWIGYIYRCIAIKYNLSSKSVYKLFNADKIIEFYNICHTYDIVDAAERMMESINYNSSSVEERAYNYMKRIIYTEKLYKLLGQEVEVIVDRPFGFNKEGMLYTQNYGYIKEIKAPDGEYQDAYVLGEDRPLKSFKGKAIAIINRLNDVEDKLVVCDKNSNYTKEEIKKMVNFQEKYFKNRIIIKKDASI